MRSALVNAITEDSTSAPHQGWTSRRAPVRETPPPMDTTAADTTTSFTPHRSRYFGKQQAMELGIGPLRARLRAALTARSPALAQLAAVDAVMEQALGEREHSLLSSVPVLLEKHFERLRQAHLATLAPIAPEDAPTPAEAATAPPWLDEFRRDMQSVLLAELDLRLQPVEGLLEALRTTP